MRKIIVIFTLGILLGGCGHLTGFDPYSGALHCLSVSLKYPEGYEEYVRQGAKVTLENVNTGSRYVILTDGSGCASFNAVNGLYRVSASDVGADDIFNGTVDKFCLSSDSSLPIALTHSKAGRIVIKEIYCGGCMKTPEQGTYQTDQYIILHNNYPQVQYLDSLCFGSLAPYNSNSTNPFLTSDPVTGQTVLPDFLPVIQCVWQFPGDGRTFPLEPGQDAVLCLRGAIDHSGSYPMSVNLNRCGYFVCYNQTYFPNVGYHPAPGNNITPDHFLDVVVKTGQANAYTYSVNSPATVIFRAPEGMTMKEYIRTEGAVIQIPGSSSDRVTVVSPEWVVDAVEVFNGASASNSKRLHSSLDAGYVELSATFLGHTLHRYVDEDLSASLGYEVLKDSNNSSSDFYERETQSLHE